MPSSAQESSARGAAGRDRTRQPAQALTDPSGYQLVGDCPRGQQVPVAGDDRLGVVRTSERDEVVVVRVVSRARSRCRVVNAEPALSDQRHERLGMTIRPDPVELPARRTGNALRQTRPLPSAARGKLSRCLSELVRPCPPPKCRGWPAVSGVGRPCPADGGSRFDLVDIARPCERFGATRPLLAPESRRPRRSVAPYSPSASSAPAGITVLLRKCIRWPRNHVRAGRPAGLHPPQQLHERLHRMRHDLRKRRMP